MYKSVFVMTAVIVIVLAGAPATTGVPTSSGPSDTDCYRFESPNCPPGGAFRFGNLVAFVNNWAPGSGPATACIAVTGSSGTIYGPYLLGPGVATDGFGTDPPPWTVPGSPGGSAVFTVTWWSGGCPPGLNPPERAYTATGTPPAAITCTRSGPVGSDGCPVDPSGSLYWPTTGDFLEFLNDEPTPAWFEVGSFGVVYDSACLAPGGSLTYRATPTGEVQYAAWFNGVETCANNPSFGEKSAEMISQ